MIIGTKPHDGGAALARHLLNPRDNDTIAVASCGLLAGDDVFAALAELRQLARGCRAKKPLLHAFASPAIEYSGDQWDEFWDRYEEEFRLVGQPWVEVRHLKSGKGGRFASHAHRCYLRVEPNGKAISLSQLAPRQEKVARIAEHRAGEPLTPGVFNMSVINWLQKDGRPEVADALVQAGFTARVPGGASSAADRARAERTGDLATDEVDERVRRAWITGAAGTALASLLEAGNLRVARGEKALVVVTPAGNVVPLLRSLNRALRRAGQPTVRKAELDSRLAGVALPAAMGLGALPQFERGRAAHVGKPRQEHRNGPRVVGTPENRHDANQASPAQRIRTDVASSMPARPARPQAPAPLVPESVRRSPEFQAIAAKFIAEFFASPTSTEAPPAGTLSAVEADTSPKNSAPSPSSPISSGGWASYRARLAGLPPKMGPRLAWVERLDDDSCSIRLKGGPVLTARPDRIVTSHAAPTCIEVMVAYAVERRWTSVSITSASTRWREDVARALTRAGVAVADPDLAAIVSSERQQITARERFAAWEELRARVRATRSDDNLRRFIAILHELRDAPRPHGVSGSLWRLLQTDIQQLRHATAANGPPDPSEESPTPSAPGMGR